MALVFVFFVAVALLTSSTSSSISSSSSLSSDSSSSFTSSKSSSSFSSNVWTTDQLQDELTTFWEDAAASLSGKTLPTTMELTKKMLLELSTRESMKFLGIDPKAASDPEVNMGPAEIIKRWDYPVQEYTATTADGYLLTVQRIPGPRSTSLADAESTNSASKKPVLFLMHGLLGSATNWIANLPNQSLAFIAADAGFDVWLGNARGNTYSKRHTQFTPKESEFWKFSWDEIAKYDIPAMVDLALWQSKQKQLYYAGHSQGSLVVFAKASEDQDFGKKIKKFFALGPVTTVGNVIGAARIFGKIHTIINAGSWITGMGEFLPKNTFIDAIAKTFCKSKLKGVCTNILFLLAGQDSAQLNVTRLPVYMTHTPAGTSAQNIVHFGQMIQSGKFQKHDYGFIGNLFHYGSYKAPEYVVSNMEIPTVLFWGGKDVLADPEDVQALIPKIKNLAGNYFDPDLDHLDYIWGTTAADTVYNVIIRMINKDENL